MRARSPLLLIALLGCTKAGTSSEPITNPSPGAKPPPAAPSLAVQITAVTLGDDCGAAAVPPAPSAAADGKGRGMSDADADWQQPCEQTSMQLAITGAPDGAHAVRVKRVELFDDQGTRIGELTPRNPTVWSQASGTYASWDQSVAPSQALSVSYMLSAPDWRKAGKRYDRNYTLKAVLAIGSSDRTVQRDVRVDAPAPLPAMVDT